MQHIPLALGQASTGGDVPSHPLPVYPPTLVTARLPPQEIRARLMVDEQGKVAEVRIDGEPQADAQRRLFAAAVREAALQWIFMPLRTSRWAADAAGNAHDVDSGPQPFSVGYLFRFAWRDGRPLVEALPLAHDGVPELGHSDD
ncbi:hypothetical protein DVT68_10325 [Dyella solisilvae]|uniref:TonB C-terminal domain-containing protein n=2 Tax=Dyella solisilvae TaxID=1920168 RepID=A0A370KB51_9GAMM|nr:hypothetical protein DVT68_10325 [Dyella solisilvae]